MKKINPMEKKPAPTTVGSGDLLGDRVSTVAYPNLSKSLADHTNAPITVEALLRCAASPERTEMEIGRRALERLLRLLDWHLGAINSDSRLHLK
jgi:hypothetical protein